MDSYPKILLSMIAFFIMFRCHSAMTATVPATINPTSLEQVVSDDDFVYKQMSDSDIKAIVKGFRNNRFTDEQISFINTNCEKFNVSVLWCLTRMQCEQGIVINLDPANYESRLSRCCGFALWAKYPPYGFEKQVYESLKCTRDHANDWTFGKIAPVLKIGYVKTRNQSTYALFRYNPYWGTSSNFGIYNVGSSLFVAVLKQFKNHAEHIKLGNHF